MSAASCSVVIPTYRRPTYLRRLLEYFRQSGQVFPIIVVDGARGGLREENSAVIGDYAAKGLDVRHLKYDERPSFSGQIFAGVKACETDYVAIISDDDFIGPDFLTRATAYLKVHPECSAVVGNRVRFKIDAEGPHGPLKDVAFFDQNSQAEKTAAERLYLMELRHIGREQSYNLLEAVQRRTHWVALANAFMETSRLRDPNANKPAYRLTDAFIEELLTTQIPLIHGQVHSIDGLNVGLNVHADQTGKMVLDRTDGIDVFTDPEWPVMYAAYKRIVTDALVDADGLQRDLAERVVDTCAWLRMSLFLGKALSTREAQLLSKGVIGRPKRTLHRAMRSLTRRVDRWMVGRQRKSDRSAGKLGRDFALMRQVIEMPAFSK